MIALVCCSQVQATLVVGYYASDGQLKEYVAQIDDNHYLFNPNGERSISLATTNWPPYISQHQCDGGWVFQLAVGLLLSKNYRVSVEFYPWARAVKLAELGMVDVLFPSYLLDKNTPSDVIDYSKRIDHLELSAPFPGGVIGFMRRKGELPEFNGQPANVDQYLVGVVRGYQNTPEFDALVTSGEIHTVNAVDDLQLAKMLFAGRVSLIVGDPETMRYAVQFSDLSDSIKHDMIASIEFVRPALQYMPLYFAISRHRKNWLHHLADLNHALAGFEKTGELHRLMNKEKQRCVANIR